MYCRNCGKRLDDINGGSCPNCFAYETPTQVMYIPYPNMPQAPKFRTAGLVLGILSICIPIYGFILGVIGLPLACISKRKSSIILNIIGIVVNIAIVVLFYVWLFSMMHYTMYHVTQEFHSQLYSYERHLIV